MEITREFCLSLIDDDAYVDRTTSRPPLPASQVLRDIHGLAASEHHVAHGMQISKSKAPADVCDI